MMTRPFAALIAATTLMASAAALAETVTIEIEAPSLDRWMYPFGASPGTEGVASLFGAFGNPLFDNRDGQFYIRFTTDSAILPGKPASSYQILSATVIVQNDNDLVFIYDNTLDPYTVFLPKSDPEFTPDIDEGQPIEIWGAGFRNGFDASSFPENGPFGPLGPGLRNVYAARFDDQGAPVDVSNSVDERYDPIPWAIGTIDTVVPGDFVPASQDIQFAIDVTQESIQQELAAGLAAGEVPFVVSSLKTVEFMAGSFARLRTKENGLVQAGFGRAARLVLTVKVGETLLGDLNGDGVVGPADLSILLGAWSSTGSQPADLDGSGVVDSADLAILLGAWS